MTATDKAAAFDALSQALTNRWYDGRWSWFCLSPCGGPQRATQAEAIADLVAWAKRIAKKPRRAPFTNRMPLEVLSVPV